MPGNNQTKELCSRRGVKGKKKTKPCIVTVDDPPAHPWPSHWAQPWIVTMDDPPARSWLMSRFLTTIGGKLILFNSVNPCMLGMHKFKECTEVPKTNYLHKYPGMPRSALKLKTEQGQAPPTLKEVWWVTWAFIRPLSVWMQMTRDQLSLLKPASLKAHSSPETHYTGPHYLKIIKI